MLCPRSLESFTNWQKAQKSKAKCQAKAANQRRDYLHKLTTHLVKQYDVIAIEDLKTKNLQKIIIWLSQLPMLHGECLDKC